MARWLAMRDQWTFRPSQVSSDLFSCTDAQNGLLLKVRATTAGIVNGNRRLYRPDRMQEGANSWLPAKERFPKPVLIGHNDDGQVVGRVLAAKYVDTSYKYATDFPVIKDSLFYRTDSKRVPLKEAVDWIVDNLMPLEDYTGLGYIELGLKLTNPEAVRKVLDDEYLTVSVGFKTDSAICSICHTDWAEDDACEHKPGSEVEGKKAFLISGHFDYEEVSFVNFPADPFAGVVTKEKLADSLKRTFFLGLPTRQQNAQALEMADSLYDADIHLVEDTMQLDLTQIADELKSADLTEARALAIKGQLSTFEAKTEDEKKSKRSLVSTLNAKIRKNAWGKTPAAESLPEVTDAEVAAVTGTPADTEGDACEGGACQTEDKPWTLEELPAADRAFFEDEDGIYHELELEMDEAVQAGELKDSDLQDAKLSSEKRKSLATATFCGPGRSFPVPDCAHVTAARRLIGRASVSGDTKKRILSCVSSKAAKLGCGGKDEVIPPATTAGSEPLTDNTRAALAEMQFDMESCGKEVVAHYNAIDKHHTAADADLRGRIHGLHHAMGEHMSSKNAIEYYKMNLAKKDMVVIDKSELAEKEEALNSASDEIEKLNQAVEAQKGLTKAAVIDSKRSLANLIAMHRVHAGADGWQELTAEQIKAKVEDLAKRNIVSLKDTVQDIMSGLKWTPSTVAQPEDKVIAPGKPVADNTQVTEPNPSTQVKDAQDAAARVAAEQARRVKLAAMTPQERRVFLADEHFQRTAKK